MDGAGFCFCVRSQRTQRSETKLLLREYSIFTAESLIDRMNKVAGHFLRHRPSIVILFGFDDQELEYIKVGIQMKNPVSNTPFGFPTGDIPNSSNLPLSHSNRDLDA